MQFTSPCVYLSNFQTIHAANFKCHISIARNNASNSIEATRGERKTFTILHFVGEIHPRSRVSEQMLRLFRKLEKLNVQRIYKICCRINSCAVKYKMQSAKKKKKKKNCITHDRCINYWEWKVLQDFWAARLVTHVRSRIRRTCTDCRNRAAAYLSFLPLRSPFCVCRLVVSMSFLCFSEKHHLLNYYKYICDAEINMKEQYV